MLDSKFKEIQEADIQTLKNSIWPCFSHCPDEFLENFRKNFLKLNNQMISLLSSMADDEIVYSNKFTSEKDFPIITYIGKISSIDKFIQKYLLYDDITSKLIKRNPDTISEFRKLVSSETLYQDKNSDGKDYFFIRLVKGSTYVKPCVQVFGFKLEKTLLGQFDDPWGGELQPMINDCDFQKWTADECMENIDCFIKKYIDEKPVFGLEKLEKICHQK